MEEGRKQLAVSAGFRRLITVALHRGQQYEGMDSIQAELSARVMELAPAGMPAQQQVTALAAAFMGLWGSHLNNREGRLCLGRSWDELCDPSLFLEGMSAATAKWPEISFPGPRPWWHGLRPQGHLCLGASRAPRRQCEGSAVHLADSGSRSADCSDCVCFPTFAQGVLGHFAS